MVVNLQTLAAIVGLTSSFLLITGWLYKKIKHQIAATSAALETKINKASDRLGALASQSDAHRIASLIESPGFEKMMAFFEHTTQADISRQLKGIEDVAALIQTYIHHADGIERILNTVVDNEPIAKLHKLIEANDKLRERFTVASASKKFLRDHFVEFQLVQEMLKEHCSIFIESGSTLASIILPILEYVKKGKLIESPQLM